jgi:hypothetical protein
MEGGGEGVDEQDGDETAEEKRRMDRCGRDQDQSHPAVPRKKDLGIA